MFAFLENVATLLWDIQKLNSSCFLEETINTHLSSASLLFYQTSFIDSTSVVFYFLPAKVTGVFLQRANVVNTSGLCLPELQVFFEAVESTFRPWSH